MKFLWTTIHVKNLEDSIRFYSDVAGLKTVNRVSPRPGVEIAFLGNGVKGETLIELVAEQGKTTDENDRCESVSIGFAVDSVEAMLKTVQDKHRLSIHGGPVDVPTGRFFSVKDPDGLNVQFFEQT